MGGVRKSEEARGVSMKKNERKPTVPEQPRPRQEVPRVTPDPTQGLTMEQVQLRHRAGWANTAVESPTKSVGQIVRENVCTFLTSSSSFWLPC